MFKSPAFILPLLFLLLAVNPGYCQTKVFLENDSMLRDYLSQSRFDIDTNAQAVFLFETGKLDLSNFEEYSNPRADYSAEYTIVKALKILNTTALKEATIAIPFAEGVSVKDIEAKVINMEEGAIKIYDVAKKDIIKENLNRNISTYKFNLANAKVGSIIYYTFKYRLDLSYSSKYFGITWNFQASYPIIHSSFELIIAPHTFYNEIPKNISFKPISTEKDLWLSDAGVFSTVLKIREGREDKIFVKKIWHRSNTPAKWEDEDYLSNSSDYNQKLNLVIINGDRYLYTSAKRMPKTWDSANTLFYYENVQYGKMIFTPPAIKDTLLDKLKEQYPDKLKLSQTIYKYFRDSISVNFFNDNLDDYVRTSKQYKVKGSKSPNCNLYLAQIMRHAGLNAFPVILSTTENERLSPYAYEPNKINYVVCLVTVNNKYYFLDASGKHLPFGVLKPRCYNGFGWLINKEGLGISMNADSLTDRNTYMATLIPTGNKGVFNLKIDQKLGCVSGPIMRARWERDSVEVQKTLTKNAEKIGYQAKVINHSLINVSNPDTPLIISYNLEITLDESKDLIYLNPFFKRFVETNPFKDVIRHHPVEFDNALNSKYILKFTLPEGYVLEEAPKPVNLTFGNNAITYSRIMLYDPKQKSFSVNSYLNGQITRVSETDYKELRSFYEAMAEDQNKSIVLKRLK